METGDTQTAAPQFQFPGSDVILNRVLLLAERSDPQRFQDNKTPVDTTGLRQVECGELFIELVSVQV